MKFRENSVSNFQIIVCVQTEGVLIISRPNRSKEAQAFFITCGAN